MLEGTSGVVLACLGIVLACLGPCSAIKLGCYVANMISFKGTS